MPRFVTDHKPASFTSKIAVIVGALFLLYVTVNFGGVELAAQRVQTYKPSLDAKSIMDTIQSQFSHFTAAAPPTPPSPLVENNKDFSKEYKEKDKAPQDKPSKDKPKDKGTSKEDKQPANKKPAAAKPGQVAMETNIGASALGLEKLPSLFNLLIDTNFTTTLRIRKRNTQGGGAKTDEAKKP